MSLIKSYSMIINIPGYCPSSKILQWQTFLPVVPHQKIIHWHNWRGQPSLPFRLKFSAIYLLVSSITWVWGDMNMFSTVLSISPLAIYFFCSISHQFRHKHKYTISIFIVLGQWSNEICIVKCRQLWCVLRYVKSATIRLKPVPIWQNFSKDSFLSFYRPTMHFIHDITQPNRHRFKMQVSTWKTLYS